MSVTINVNLDHTNYPIYIGNALIENTAEILSASLSNRKVFIVSDTNVSNLYLNKLENSLKKHNIVYKSIVIDAGEKTKSFQSANRICNWLLENNIERSSMLIGLGGGVIGDLTGFVASITLRGIDFIQIPTTLLSQVDSSVGGKTGINTPQGKNLIGTFFQPKAVISDSNTIKTLPKRQVLAGYSEICKYGLINNFEFWCWLEKNGHLVIQGDSKYLNQAVKTSCISKAEIVKKDEKESGERALLNLGHTFAHALENELNYSDELLHGEAVSIGIILAFTLSNNLGYCSTNDVKRIANHFKKVNLRMPSSISKNMKIDNIIDNMSKDKKVKNNKITFVLVRGIGKAFLTQDVELGKLRESLESINKTF